PRIVPSRAYSALDRWRSCRAGTLPIRKSHQPSPLLLDQPALHGGDRPRPGHRCRGALPGTAQAIALPLIPSPSATRNTAMKIKVLTLSVALGVTAIGGITSTMPARASGIPVLDVANLMNAIQQYTQMVEQLAQLQ